IAFVPGMVGLILGQVFAGSVRMLLALPLLAAFVLALTALTYQFQGWLASLMSNPRRRRTVVVFVTGGFILLAQAPNLINVARPWEGMTGTDSVKWSMEQRAAANADVNAKKITFEEYTRRGQEINKEYEERR